MRIVTGHQGTLQHLRKAVEASRAFCENQENHIALYNLTESLHPLFTHQAHRGGKMLYLDSHVRRAARVITCEPPPPCRVAPAIIKPAT